MPSTNNKRKKYTSQPLNVKLNAVEQLNNGVLPSTIAANLNVTVPTVLNWRKNQDRLKEWKDKCENEVKNKKRMRKISNDLVDKAVWIWFKERRAAGIPIQGAYLQTQAKYFHSVLGETNNFEASNGWLHKWQNRYGIRCLTLCGEKLSADKSAADDFKIEFAEYIEAESFTPDQVFNCDETGLNYKMLPKTTLSAKCEAGAPGMKGNKERLTVMACSNASGTCKLPLMVIGKYAKPRAIKNLTSLPVYYRNQKSAWMNKLIFSEWFESEFIPRVTEFLQERGLPMRAVLFVDNCAAHPQTLLRDNFIIRFFPPNTTSLIQPMDQGCLQTLKLYYRQALMKHILDYINREETLARSLKDMTIKDVIFWVANAWEHVAATTIRKSWNQLWPIEDSTDLGTAATPDIVQRHSEEDGARVAVDGIEKSLEIDNSRRGEDNALCLQFCEKLREVQQYTDIETSDVHTWLHSSLSILPEDCLNEEDIVQILQDDQSSNKENASDDENLIEADSERKNPTSAIIGLNDKVSITESRIALDTVIQYCTGNPYYTEEIIGPLYRLRDKFYSEFLKLQPHMAKMV